MRAVLAPRAESATSLDLSLPGRPARLRLQHSPSRARVVAPCLTLAGMLGSWSFASHVLLDPERRFLLPPPESVIARGLLEGSSLSEMSSALLSTSEVALVGLLTAIVLGVSVGIAMSQARWVEYSIYPYAIVLQTIPILAVVPLLGYWFGFDFRSRVVVCVLVSLFPLITNTLYGLRSVDPAQHDLFTLMGASRVQRLLHLQLPAALPAIVTGCKIAAGLAVIGSIVADFFFRQGEPGIGRLIDIYRQRLATEQLMTALFLSSLLGLLLFGVFEVLAHALERRRGSTRRD
jgi:NitT/TauT family transport system permease protein